MVICALIILLAISVIGRGEGSKVGICNQELKNEITEISNGFHPQINFISIPLVRKIKLPQ